MEPETPQDLTRFTPVVTAAERIVSEKMGRPVHLGETQLLSEEGRRNVLLRCADLSAGSPSSFIIKQVVTENYNPEDSGSWDVQRFFKDWAGVQFLSELGVTPAYSPRFYGGDRSLGFFVIEDLGPHQSLVQPLLEESAASAERRLREFATTLGRLHASTIGKKAQYQRIYQDLHPDASLSDGAGADSAADATKIATLLDPFHLPLDIHCTEEIRRVRDAIESPGPFVAFIHGDPCPDNDFLIGEQLYLIDFEFARFGHALIDGVYGRMMFPTCWCCNRLPRPVVDMMEAAYRAELAQGLPEAEDDRIFYSALVNACAYWALRSLTWHLERALEEDGQWGIASVRSRILARLDAFIETSREHNQLPALRSTLSRVLGTLRQRWPETDTLPLYPAFR